MTYRFVTSAAFVIGCAAGLHAISRHARREAHAGRSWRARWLRPVPLAASTAVAAACAILLYVAVGARPPADLASMEADGLASRIEMIDNYRVVEQLDLLEDLDVIRNLDRLAPTREGARPLAGGPRSASRRRSAPGWAQLALTQEGQAGAPRSGQPPAEWPAARSASPRGPSAWPSPSPHRSGRTA